MIDNATPLEQVEWLADNRQEFSQLVIQRQVAKQAEDAAKARREELDQQIEAMLLVGGDNAPKVAVGNRYVVQRVTSRSASKLEGRRLLELGVSATVIKQATVEGKPYSYVMVKELGD